MTSAKALRETFRSAGLLSWRSAYDFDYPAISVRARVERLRRAIVAAEACRSDPQDLVELAYARAECTALLALPSLEGEAANVELVSQRVARVRRIVTHHEGAFARLNRRYWWVPFWAALAVMAVACVSDVAARLGPGGIW